jgi:hypothetical protein
MQAVSAYTLLSAKPWDPVQEPRGQKSNSCPHNKLQGALTQNTNDKSPVAELLTMRIQTQRARRTQRQMKVEERKDE